MLIAHAALQGTQEDRPDTRWRLAHRIWHLFVMAGSASHFVSVLYFID